MHNHVVKLAPSILAADVARLGEQVAEAERAGADRIHVDVMDGLFVPNIAIEAPMVQSLRRVTHLPMETHLMISDPELFLGRVCRGRFDLISRPLGMVITICTAQCSELRPLENVLEWQSTPLLPRRFCKKFSPISTRYWS
jgi:hypothetical protein